MAEIVAGRTEVYIKEVNWYTTIVTAASDEDAKVKAEKEHTTLEGYEHQESSLKFMTGDFFWANVAGNDEPEDRLDQLRADYAELEAENARLKKELSKLKGEPKDESGSEAEPEVKVESDEELNRLHNAVGPDSEPEEADSSISIGVKAKKRPRMDRHR